MGAEAFTCTHDGPDVAAAFSGAVHDAQYDYGHAGYTGTIAEKDDYVLTQVPQSRWPHTGLPSLDQALEYAEDQNRSNTGIGGDKWGPAAAVEYRDEINGHGWVFFGWASS